MGGAPEKQIKEALKQRTSDRPRQFFIKVCGAIDKEYSSLYLLRPKHLDRQILIEISPVLRNLITVIFYY